MPSAVDAELSTHSLLDSLAGKIERALAGRSVQAVVVLGSGLSVASAQALDIETKWDLPRPDHRPAIDGHPGMLALGKWADRQVLVFLGRCHGYEGHPWSRIALPPLLAHRVRAKLLVLTNMAGTINRHLGTRQLMPIVGHLNATGYTWELDSQATTFAELVAGVPRAVLGPGVEVSTAPYHVQATALLRQVLAKRPTANTSGLSGVYAGVMGPNYETLAEVRALRAMGADVVGMSTVAEAEVAHQLGVPVVGLSCLSNWAAGADPLDATPAREASGPSATIIDHQEVIDAGQALAHEFQTVLSTFLRRWTFSD